MNKCQFVQERYGEQYCLATKEQDVASSFAQNNTSNFFAIG